MTITLTLRMYHQTTIVLGENLESCTLTFFFGNINSLYMVCIKNTVGQNTLKYFERLLKFKDYYQDY